MSAPATNPPKCAHQADWVAAATQSAWWAHLGGFVAGALIHRFFIKHSRLLESRTWLEE
mgnify:CR=1 FL=1